MKRARLEASGRVAALALAAITIAAAAQPRVALAQSRVAVTAEAGFEQPIARWRRQTRSGPVAGVAIESGNPTSSTAFLASFTYSHLATKPYRSLLLQGDHAIWRLMLGGIRRTSASRPMGVLITGAAGVAIVEEASYGIDNPARTNWAPALSAGLGAEYRRASLQLRLRTELWVHPLTYSPDAYGSPAAVRTTFGIGFVRQPARRN